MTLHIHTAPSQPATRFVDWSIGDILGRKITMQYRRRRQFWAGCCRKRRWAAYLNVHVYYDLTRFTCKPGKGCKRR